MAGDAGQGVDEAAWSDRQAEFRRAGVEAAIDRQREGRAAELGRVEPQKEVVHDRIADHRHFKNLATLDVRLRREFADQRVHRRADNARQLDLAAGIHHHVGDAAHQIFAEADLRVHRSGGGEDVAGCEIAEMGGDRGRADVERHAVGAVAKAGQDRDDVALLA